MVVLDGVRDLMADINDGVNAQAIVEKLMRLAQDTNCCIVCVLHQNKGNEDRNPRGWIGTELMNKAKVQSLLNCGTQMWNNMFSEMRDKGAIIRSKNKDGKYVWQLPVVQEDMFSGLDGGPGDSPSS